MKSTNWHFYNQKHEIMVNAVSFNGAMSKGTVYSQQQKPVASRDKLNTSQTLFFLNFHDFRIFLWVVLVMFIAVAYRAIHLSNQHQSTNPPSLLIKVNPPI